MRVLSNREYFKVSTPFTACARNGLSVRLTFWIAWSVPTVAMMRAGVERRLSPTTIPVALSTVTPESGERKKTGAGVISAPLKLKAPT